MIYRLSVALMLTEEISFRSTFLLLQYSVSVLAVYILQTITQCYMIYSLVAATRGLATPRFRRPARLWLSS